MNPARVLVICLSLFCMGRPLHAARPGAGSLPSRKLQPLVMKMGPALVLYEGSDGKLAPTGQARAAVLRAEFSAARVTAPEADRPRYDAAIALCDVITNATKERLALKARANLSGEFHGKGKIGSTKKGPQGNEKFFAEHIKADWKKRKAELLAQINLSYSKLKEIEARTQH